MASSTYTARFRGNIKHEDKKDVEQFVRFLITEDDILEEHREYEWEFHLDYDPNTFDSDADHPLTENSYDEDDE